MSLAFRKCVWFHYYIFIIAEWPVPLQNVCPYKCILMSYLGHLRQRQWPLRNGPGMSLWPTTPTGFLATPWPNRDHWITITYHMNSCHLLMGGSLGAETSLTDWNVQEISSILLTKCLFIFYFQTVYILKEKGSMFMWVFFICLQDKNLQSFDNKKKQSLHIILKFLRWRKGNSMH